MLCHHNIISDSLLIITNIFTTFGREGTPKILISIRLCEDLHGFNIVYRSEVLENAIRFLQRLELLLVVEKSLFASLQISCCRKYAFPLILPYLCAVPFYLNSKSLVRASDDFISLRLEHMGHILLHVKRNLRPNNHLLLKNPEWRSNNDLSYRTLVFIQNFFSMFS